jgi:hypothetical protein
MGGRVTGPGSVALTVDLQQEQFPFGTGFKDVGTARTSRSGGYLFDIDNLWTTTRYRVATRTQTVIMSPTVTARSAVRTRIGVRNLSRKKARISGTIRPAVNATVVLQRRSASGRWQRIRTATRLAGATSTTFSFKVWRAKKVTRRYRVVATPEAGAYVRGYSNHAFVSRRPGRGR